MKTGKVFGTAEQAGGFTRIHGFEVFAGYRRADGRGPLVLAESTQERLSFHGSELSLISAYNVYASVDAQFISKFKSTDSCGQAMHLIDSRCETVTAA